MTTWLVCPSCQTKQALLPLTEFHKGCVNCGCGPLYAEGDDGLPVVVLSAASDPNDWSVNKSVGEVTLTVNGQPL